MENLLNFNENFLQHTTDYRHSSRRTKVSSQQLETMKIVWRKEENQNQTLLLVLREKTRATMRKKNRSNDFTSCCKSQITLAIDASIHLSFASVSVEFSECVEYADNFTATLVKKSSTSDNFFPLFVSTCKLNCKEKNYLLKLITKSLHED